MTVVGLDDTDSRAGMCTTYVAARVAERLREGGAAVERLLLVRLNPAVEHKTRGNAALAVHTDADPDVAFDVARQTVAELADVDGTATDAAAPQGPGVDPAEGDTNPGVDPAGAATNPAVVVADHAPGAAPGPAVDWASAAVTDHLDRARALELVDELGYRHAGWGNERGTVGALAAVGAWASGRTAGGITGRPGDWTYECIAYRDPERWGTARDVDHDAVFAAAADAYPAAWDTVDRATGQAVCVPNTPCPILLGVRGDDPDAVRAAVERATADDGEPVAHRELFVTNQGTDAHLREARLGASADAGPATVADGAAYRVDGVVATDPETRAGGHVHLVVRNGGESLPCVAFEPTGRFRDRVRALRSGDRVTVCGEVADGTLKLEKFAVRSLARMEPTVPACPDCGNSMESAGAGQGYRCRDCGTTAAGKVPRPLERDLDLGWYEVPPSARRHVARPLVRGGFDAPVHPEG